MGSLKDEMRGLSEDHKPCEKADDGERPGGSDGSAEPEGPQINTSQESSTQQSYQPKLHMNASYDEETDKNPISKDDEDSGVCDNADQTDSSEMKDLEEICQTQDLDATKDTKNNTKPPNEILIDGESNSGIQGGTSEGKNKGHEKEKETEIGNITIPVPLTPGPSEPCTPAPFGQHHMRTQVSLEVVQCHSAATSPMTPPEGSHSFFFPSSLGRSTTVGGDTKDAELQVGRQMEFCSVATSPMTPKTPFTTAFPELNGREMVQKREERVKQREGREVTGSFPAAKSQAETEAEKAGDSEFSTSKEQSEGSGTDVSPESSTRCPAMELTDSQLTEGDSHEQCKQQRMGSVDQDITILVTHHGNNEGEEEERAESSPNPLETEMVKIDEREEIGGENNVKREDVKEQILTEAPDHAENDSNSTLAQTKTAESSASEAKTHTKCENSEVQNGKAACEDVSEVPGVKHAIPESPAPFGCHNMRTQVSLEVVQCQSAATSPMTPPEGDQAFCFPSAHVRCEAVGAETKDAELQVGRQVEYRSVATTPMTPRTPVSTTFPEIRKETSTEEKIVEVDEAEEEQKKAGEEAVKEERNCKEKCEEPIQEVSWDEKGMTWEVYGAVVEVTVLGSAIQKHLEKQVRKQKLQPSMHPPPPLNPSAMHLASEGTHGGSGSGKGKRGEQDGEVGRRRRNPFRQLMENMQQPHCCSRAHSAE
ncbi:uncharacterized protein LOC122880833 [Xyrichtys novacula]|uniref:Uncharacterized protein LOC122880833 n=1 Tax=Xyrichtys novacula TaxID=13765 RepID=A0AAV1FAI1_XYRNO|nr:uncharacterized protein LOC122880833 [Xyrichtys novacula]